MDNEDLSANEMFVAIRTMRPGLLEYAGEKGWLVCIPQSLSLRGKIEMDDIDNHVLMPCAPTNGPVVDYTTLNSKRVQIIGNSITTVSGFKEKRTVQVIYTEDFLNAHTFSLSSTRRRSHEPPGHIFILSQDESASSSANSSARVSPLMSSNNSQNSRLSPKPFSSSTMSTTTVAILHLDRPLEGGSITSCSVESFDALQIAKYMVLLLSYPEHELIFKEIDHFTNEIIEMGKKAIIVSQVHMNEADHQLSQSLHEATTATTTMMSTSQANQAMLSYSPNKRRHRSGQNSNLSTPDASPVGSPSLHSSSGSGARTPSFNSASFNAMLENRMQQPGIFSLLQPRSNSIALINHPYYSMNPPIEVFIQAWVAAGIGTLLSSNSFLEDIGERYHSQRKLYRTQFQYVVESYIMNRLHDSIFPYYCLLYAVEDIEFDKNVTKMQNLSVQDLGIRREFQCSQVEASALLSGIEKHRTPLHKLLCLQSVVSEINRAVQRNLVENNCDLGLFSLSADDVLDQLILVIISASSKGLKHFVAQLAYCRKFHCTNIDTTLLGYTLANFEGAVEYILKRKDFSDSIIRKASTSSSTSEKAR